MPYKDTRIYADRAEYLKRAVAKRRRTLLDKARKYKGGKCNLCGYKKCGRALHFHHLNPEEKEFALSARGMTRSWGKVKKELDKCILVCANCHAENPRWHAAASYRNVGCTRGELLELFSVPHLNR